MYTHFTFSLPYYCNERLIDLRQPLSTSTTTLSNVITFVKTPFYYSWIALYNLLNLKSNNQIKTVFDTTLSARALFDILLIFPTKSYIIVTHLIYNLIGFFKNLYRTNCHLSSITNVFFYNYTYTLVWFLFNGVV